jgi:hypothetical protein
MERRGFGVAEHEVGDLVQQIIMPCVVRLAGQLVSYGLNPFFAQASTQASAAF